MKICTFYIWEKKDNPNLFFALYAKNSQIDSIWLADYFETREQAEDFEKNYAKKIMGNVSAYRLVRITVYEEEAENGAYQVFYTLKWKDTETPGMYYAFNSNMEAEIADAYHFKTRQYAEAARDKSPKECISNLSVIKIIVRKEYV